MTFRLSDGMDRLKLLGDTGSGFGSLTQNLVGYWPLNEFSDASGPVTRADVSGNGNHLTDNNTVPSIAGIRGNAGDFTAANLEYLSRESFSHSAQTVTQLSCSYWYKKGTHTLTSTNPAMSTDYTAASSGIILWGRNDGAVLLYIPNSSQSAVSPAGLITSGSNYHHIIWIYDGTQGTNDTKVVCHVDGVQRTLTFTGTIPTQSPNNILKPGIGRFSTFYGEGDIDEVALWLRPLTADEVTSLWNSGAGRFY